jgi:hypothetical protein
MEGEATAGAAEAFPPILPMLALPAKVDPSFGLCNCITVLISVTDNKWQKCNFLLLTERKKNTYGRKF